MTNGLEVNGLEMNSLGPNGYSLNGYSLNGYSLNGLLNNGYSLNGYSLNGLGDNGYSLNGYSLNGLSLNGYSLNGVGDNGYSLNGYSLNSLQINGYSLNGYSLNGYSLNGYSLNGYSLNSVLYAAMPLDAAGRENLDIIMTHLVGCALAAGDSVTMTGVDGNPRTYTGQRGYAPEWKTGPLSKTGDANVRACLLNTNYPGITQAQVPIPVLAGSSNLAAARKLVKYLAQCAMNTSQSIVVGPDTIVGVFGLAPEWYSGPPSALGERRVSACLAARTNPLAKTVQISVRGLGIPVSALEKTQFGRHEGAFWGNLFSANPHISMCNVNGGGIAGRVCTTPGGCGFEDLGTCAVACTTRDANGDYAGCNGDSEVINTHLAFSNDVALATGHTCLRRADGTVHCWGSQQFGQLGNNTVSSSIQIDPVPVLRTTSSYLTGIDELVVGGDSTCAKAKNGQAWCWGRNVWGQIGIGTTSSVEPMARAAYMGDAAQLAGGPSPCAVRVDGTISCWGNDQSGTVGNNTTFEYAVTSPTPVAGPGGAIQIGGIGSTHCAVYGDGVVRCWGGNSYGQIGDGTSDINGLADKPTPALVKVNATTPLAGATATCSGLWHSCALREDGDVACWGLNNKKQLGTTAVSQSVWAIPSATLPHPATQLVCGSDHVCALLDNKEVYCWGDNSYGQLARDPYYTASSASAALATTGVERLVAGVMHTCGRKADGTLWCWGSNGWGQLGLGYMNPYVFTPTRLGYDTCGNGVCSPSEGEDCSTCAADCAQPETCDGVDNDCDGTVDDGMSPQMPFYRDGDNDGYGNDNVVQLACAAPIGFVTAGGDCNDASGTLHPNTTYYQDADGDGFGNAGVTTVACAPPAGYIANSGDCDDTRTGVHPGAAEVCNGLDDNCTGGVDEGVLSTFYADADADGFGNASTSTQACTLPAGYQTNSTDCNDANAAIRPNAIELANSIDDDCDTFLDETGVGFYEETSPWIRFAGAWTARVNNKASGGTYKDGNSSSATASITATVGPGAAVVWTTRKANDRGIAEVRIDGGAWVAYDLYAKSAAWKATISFPLTAGTHTVEIRPKGVKNAASSSVWIDVDALEVK